jgi:predicted TPR repeat methyltransferase
MRELLRFDEAASCFERALALGADPELNSFYLASVRGGDVPPTSPRRYVQGLFDDYAADFQSHVAEKLEYRGFEVLLKPFLGNGRRYKVLDLGCGTGLCGALIAPQADILDGVDVSIAMLEEARKHQVYRELVHADLGEFLAATTSQWDLLLAADVFVYVGDLAAILRSARRILAPGGCLAFTVELASEGKDIQLLGACATLIPKPTFAASPTRRDSAACACRGLRYDASKARRSRACTSISNESYVTGRSPGPAAQPIQPFANVISPPVAPTFTASPAAYLPRAIPSPTGFSICCWIARFNGRAP